MKLTLEEKIFAGVAILLVAIVGIWWIHRDGEKAGALNQEIKTSAVVVKTAKADVVTEVKKSVAKRKEYHAARAKVEVKGDSVIADGQRVDMPSVASLIKVADARGEQDSASMRKQDLLVAATGHQLDLVEEMKKPRCGKKCGIAIGVVGTVGTVYVVLRVIEAVAKAHK